MSKNRKHRQSPVSAPASASSSETIVQPPDNGVRPSGGVFSRSVLLQLLAIVGLSCVLGFTFNAASPVGVRFGEPAVVTVSTNVTAAAIAIPVTPAQTNPAAAPSPPLPSIQPVVSRPAPISISHTVANPFVAAPTTQTVQTNPAPIHWPEAKELVAKGRAMLVDVRHAAMFDAGHIPGAISLPETSPPEEFKMFLSTQPTNLTVIVYCSSTSCSQSARVANRLVNEFRWPSVRYMTGGYLEYQQTELAKPAPAPTP